jgi:hypothetical protein
MAREPCVMLADYVSPRVISTDFVDYAKVTKKKEREQGPSLDGEQSPLGDCHDV